jgi:hypothetical protein
MKVDAAFVILEIDIREQETITFDIIKRQYRRMALKYHPDKNSAEDAVSKFQQIRDAYDVLCKKYNEDGNYFTNDIFDHGEQENVNYNSYLFSFLKSLFSKDDNNTNSEADNEPDMDPLTKIKNKLLTTIINRVVNTCEDKAIDLLKKVDKGTLLKIADVLHKYRDLFHINETLFQRIKSVIDEKYLNDECIILNPLIDDIMDCFLYKLVENGETYYVPLWHHELVYDNKGNDLYIRCVPILPENMKIDNNNRIHIDTTSNIVDIFNNKCLVVEIGKKTITIPAIDIKIQEHQDIILYSYGIPRINTVNIYDISHKCDIIIHLTLTGGH